MESKKNRMLIGLATAAALVAMAGGTATAQRAGGQGGFGGNRGGFGNFAPAPIMKASADGVFVLANGTLTKYNSAMKEQGSLKLIEAPKPPSDSSDGSQMPVRPAPGSMIAGQGKVVAVIGDQLFLVDAVKFDAATKAKLPTMQAPPPDNGSNGPGGPGQPGGGMRGMQPSFQMPAVLEMNGQYVYVLRGNEIVGFDMTAGKVTGIAALPKPPAPAPPSNGD